MIMLNPINSHKVIMTASKINEPNITSLYFITTKGTQTAYFS